MKIALPILSPIFKNIIGYSFLFFFKIGYLLKRKMITVMSDKHAAEPRNSWSYPIISLFLWYTTAYNTSILIYFNKFQIIILQWIHFIFLSNIFFVKTDTRHRRVLPPFPISSNIIRDFFISRTFYYRRNRSIDPQLPNKLLLLSNQCIDWGMQTLKKKKLQQQQLKC